MSDHQLRLLFILSGSFLTAKVLMWVGFGVYLWVTGRA